MKLNAIMLDALAEGLKRAAHDAETFTEEERRVLFTAFDVVERPLFDAANTITVVGVIRRNAKAKQEN